MTDTFRKEYKPLTEPQKMDMEAVKTEAEKLEVFINRCTNSENGRLMSMAKSYLEIAIMLAVKGITQ